LIYAFEKWMPGPPGSHKGTQGNIALIALLVSAGGLAAITAQVIGLRGSLEKIQKDKKLMAAEQANMSKLRTVKQLFNFPKGINLPASDTNLPAVYPDPYFRTAATKADGTLRSTTGGSASWALWGGSTSPAGSPNFYGKKLAISSISPEKSDLARVFAGTTVPATVMGPVTSALPVSPDVAVSQLNSSAVNIGGKVYYRPATLDLAVNTSYQKGSLEEASTKQGPLRQLALKARLTLQAPPRPTCSIAVDKSVIDTGQSVRATMIVNGIAVRGQMFVPRRAAAAATFGPAVHAQANSIYARNIVLLASNLTLSTTSYPSERQQVTGNVLAADLASTVACTPAAVTVKRPPPPPPDCTSPPVKIENRRDKISELFGTGFNDSNGVLLDGPQLAELCKNVLGARTMGSVKWDSYEGVRFRSPGDNKLCRWKPSPPSPRIFSEKECVRASDLGNAPHLGYMTCSCR
jgi:hypothetical protein